MYQSLRSSLIGCHFPVRFFIGQNNISRLALAAISLPDFSMAKTVSVASYWLTFSCQVFHLSKQH
jgi:hypothetical protein